MKKEYALLFEPYPHQLDKGHTEDWIKEQILTIHWDSVFLEILNRRAGHKAHRDYWMGNLRTDQEKQLAILACANTR